MPFLFLSPSTQEFNPYFTTENEEYWMNRIADEMEPYLRASAVNFTRNDPTLRAADAIRKSNAGRYDFHLALHSNAAPVGKSYRGIDVYYYPESPDGRRMADILVANLREIYPLPDRVRALETTAIGEVRLTAAPAVLVELGYHDNPEDALWITQNTADLAAVLAKSVDEYFGLPYLLPTTPRDAVVRTQGGSLNLRAYPRTDAPIYGQIPNGATAVIYGEYGPWYTVAYDGIFGYAAGQYLI